MLFQKQFYFFFVCLLMLNTLALHSVEKVQKGKLPVYDETYIYERTNRTLTIKDPQHHVVFQSNTKQKNQWIAGFGHNGDMDSFYVFHQSFSPPDASYHLTIETGENIRLSTLESKEPIYQPILIKNRKLFIIYVTEKFQLMVRNLDTGAVCHRLKFNCPVRLLREERFPNQRIISYQIFHPPHWENHYLNVEEIGSKIFRQQGEIYPQSEIKQQLQVHPEAGRIFRQDAPVLNYRKIVGFGDSITYGQIASEYHPELGYIPRLQEILDNDGFQTTVINEGLGNRKATTSFDEFTTALSHHRGKFLLLHLGTNDVRFWTIPISDVIYSIQQMTDTALSEGVLPVLSTLIPRNHPIYFDILRHRGKSISKDIREIATATGLPMVDFWDLFLNYPESDGGNLSLMSDDTHPSEKGYQLMAENWYPTVLRFPPDAPSNIIKRSVSTRSVTIQWDPNKEFDIEHYLVEFGYVHGSLNHRVVADSPEFTFIRYYFTNPLLNMVYYKISAVDRSGHIGPATAIHTINFVSE